MLSLLQKHIEFVLKSFSFDEPLHLFLKRYFRQNKKLGSRDRKIISSSVYNYFRLGKSLHHLSTEEKIKAANCLSENISKSVAEKIDDLKKSFPTFSEKEIFPFAEILSPEINYEKFCCSFLRQPLTWIRIREKFYLQVIKEVEKNNFKFIKDDKFPLALGFKNSTQLTQLKSFESGYFEIQDLSSQQTLNLISAKADEHWWDCCAGSGGKSLLFKEKFPQTNLLISDSRESVLENAKLRLKKTNAKNISFENINLLLPNSQLPIPDSFEGIIADVPCTGSGTWARAPEMIQTFNTNRLNEFAAKQKQIVKNILPKLKNDGTLLYITCSVFKMENEDVIDFCKTELNLTCLHHQYISGYEGLADTMFVANLKK